MKDEIALSRTRTADRKTAVLNGWKRIITEYNGGSVAGTRIPVVVGEGRQTVVCPRKKTLNGTTFVSLPTHGCSERVARERAGGERGLLFAGQKASRVHPSIAAASSAVAATMR